MKNKKVSGRRKRLFYIVLALILATVFITYINLKSNNTSTSTNPNVVKEAVVPLKYKSTYKKVHYYANSLHLSKNRIYTLLTSKYGEHLSTVEVNYALQNIQTSWNENALITAKSLRKDISKSDTDLSADRLRLMLNSIEMFTQKQTDYAIQHLNDK